VYQAWRQYASTSDSAPASAVKIVKPTALEKPDYLDTAESEIWDKLAAEFAPTELMVQDISGGCGSMYGIEIASEQFRGATMLKQQRMVNGVLGEQMKDWHGVQLRTKVPGST
jgi:BolA-like protein 3